MKLYPSDESNGQLACLLFLAALLFYLSVCVCKRDARSVLLLHLQYIFSLPLFSRVFISFQFP